MRARAFALAALIALAAPAAGAVVILEHTWRANGGGEENWAGGFGAHDALAREPQFRAMVALTQDRREWGVASGVWLGNAGGSAYVLTAGHVVTDGTRAEQIELRSAGGTVRRGVEYFVHPGWNNQVDTRGGMDFAIIRFDGPVNDAGPAPALYSGRDELGKRAVMIGAGTHGVAPYGHGYRFGPDHGAVLTAAENVIDRVVAVQLGGELGDWGNHLSIDLDEPGGSKNRFGDAAPISPLEGVLAPGDSGGSLWASFNGRWRVVGVNSSGDPGADYQDVSNFARVSTQRQWIRSIFPGVRFEGDKVGD